MDTKHKKSPTMSMRPQDEKGAAYLGELLVFPQIHLRDRNT